MDTTNGNSNGTAHPFTCNSCQVAFRNSDLQRSHMRTDWHRYNLKRRVASLPPLASEVFAEKVLKAQASSSAVAAKASFERVCTACQRTYYSENAFQNHLGSQKHRLRATLQSNDDNEDEVVSVMSSTIVLGEPINVLPNGSPPDATEDAIDPEAEAEFSKVINDIKETSLADNEPVSRRPTRPHYSAEERRIDHPISPQKDTESTTGSTVTDGIPSEEVPLRRCLFCNFISSELQTNVIHMNKRHSMFIPEQTFLIDLGGLISWLYTRIHNLHECLYCHKFKNSAAAVQTHMRDVGHCKIAFEEEQDMIEVGQFYDFTSTYSDGEDAESEDEDTQTGVKIPKAEAGTDDESGENDKDEGDGWETDSSASDSDTTPLPRPLGVQPAYATDYELHLPSGRTAGHRSLNRYFRQNLHNHPSATERLEAQQQRLLTGAVTEDDGKADERGRDRQRKGQMVVSRANGGLGMLGVGDAKKKEVMGVEKREVKRAQRAEKRYQWGVEKRGNMQKHFRDPLLQ